MTQVRYLQGEKFFLNPQNEFMSDLKHVKQHPHWYPDDMIDTPDVFLKEIDSESGKFGYKAGLRTWLQLAQAGWMDTGGRDTETKARFEAALATLEKS